MKGWVEKMDDELITIPKSVYESERKMRFFGESSEKVYDKQFNIFIGVSISNKKLTPEMALNYLGWAVKNAKEKVAVVIADELNIVNYRILDGYSLGKSEKRAEKEGKKFRQLFEDAIKKLDKEDQNKVNIYMWGEIKKNSQYKKIQSFLEERYPKDVEFKSAILYFIKKYMRKKGRMVEDLEKIDELASYILGELPTLLEGITVEDIYYGLCIYPTYFSSGMSQFVMDMHERELAIGNDLKNILKSKAVLVEAWLD